MRTRGSSTTCSASAPTTCRAASTAGTAPPRAGSGGSLPHPAPLHARPPARAGRPPAGEPRPVALLLLRRLLRAVPARRGSRRDHDEPPALAHGPVRLHRAGRAVLPVADGADRGDGRRSRSSPARASWRTGSLGRREPRGVRRRRRVPAGARRARVRLGDGRRAAPPAARELRAHVALHARRRRRRPGAALAVPAAGGAPARALLHAATLPRVQGPPALGDPPRPGAELRHDARAHRALPAADAARARGALGVHVPGYLAAGGLLVAVSLMLRGRRGGARPTTCARTRPTGSSWWCSSWWR